MEQIERVCKRELSQWPLYRPEHLVLSKALINDVWWVGYRTQRLRIGTYFDLNIQEFSCYLLDIELEECLRGHGLGHSLYQTIERIAKACGCQKLITTPSGRTATGETRKDYLLRRGWTNYGKWELVKTINDS